MQLSSWILRHSILVVGLYGQLYEEDTDSTELLQLKFAQSVRPNDGEANDGEASQIPSASLIRLAIQARKAEAGSGLFGPDGDIAEAFGEYLSDADVVSQVYECLQPRRHVVDEVGAVRLDFVALAEITKIALARWEVEDGRMLSLKLKENAREMIERGRQEAEVLVQLEVEAGVAELENSYNNDEVQLRISNFIGNVATACGDNEARSEAMTTMFMRAAQQNSEDKHKAAEAIGLSFPLNATAEDIAAISSDLRNRTDEFLARLNEAVEINEDDSDSLLHRIINDLEDDCYKQLDVTGFLFLGESDECNSLFNEVREPHQLALTAKHEDQLKHVLILHTHSSNPDSAGHQLKRRFDNDGPSKGFQRNVHAANATTLLVKKRLLHLEKSKQDIRDSKCEANRELREKDPQHWTLQHVGLSEYIRCLCRTGEPTKHCNLIHMPALLDAQKEMVSRLREVQIEHEAREQAKPTVQTVTLDEMNRTVLAAIPIRPCAKEPPCCSIAVGGHEAELCRSKSSKPGGRSKK